MITLVGFDKFPTKTKAQVHKPNFTAQSTSYTNYISKINHFELIY